MFSFWWTTLVALLCISLAEVKSETTAATAIPNHLLECYMDPGIYHRDNRFPPSFEVFLDLVRKVESSPTSRNINARELAMVLLHYFKMDGIQSLESHAKHLPHDILPFAPYGDEYFKHRLTLVGLVPRVEHNYMAAVNESLTTKEMCNLHFMLSYSIEPYKRDDETCTQIYEEKGVGHPDQGSDWDVYQNIHGYYKRHRRNIDHPHHSNRVHLDKKYKEKMGKSLRKTEIKEPKHILRKRTLESLEDDGTLMMKREIRNHEDDLKNLQQLQKRTRRQEENSAGNKKAEVESIAFQHSRIEKDKFTIGDMELLSAGEDHPSRGMQSLVQTHDFGRYGSRFFPRAGHSTGDSSYSGILPDVPLSECPAVNGVITTPYGPLTIGVVIAGIGAGLNPEDIPPTRLGVSPPELESPTDRLKNVWGATIAGVVADSLSSPALMDINNLQILRGGWNDTSTPKWYLLKANKVGHMTDVAIRGSLDGLFLGLNIKEWTNKFSNFKLSQILQTYYTCAWNSVGAKYRVQLRSKYAPDEIFRKQVHLMSLVLKKQKKNAFTVLDYRSITRTAVTKVIQHIENVDNSEKGNIGSFMATEIDLLANLVAVVDSSWGHESLFQIFQKIRRAEIASTPFSNLTVVCGNDGRILMTGRSSIDLSTKFTKDALMENCTRGLNLPLVFDTMSLMYRQIYYDEKVTKEMKTNAQVLVLFPYDSMYQENLEYSVEKSRNFRQTFPDVRLMVAASSRPESFQPLVKSSKDLFQISSFVSDQELSSVDKFIEGIKQGYQRISRPSCGSYFDDQTVGSEIRVTRDTGPGQIAFYRLLPQYFFTVKGTATVSIRSKQRAPLQICHSREIDRPVNPAPRDQPDYNRPRDPYRPEYSSENSPFDRQRDNDSPVLCKTITSEPYKIELNDPCAGAPTLEDCHPLYISLSPALQEGISTDCSRCRLPVSVQFEIAAEGLTCYNSASAIILSPFLLSALLLFFFSSSL